MKKLVFLFVLLASMLATAQVNPSGVYVSGARGIPKPTNNAMILGQGGKWISVTLPNCQTGVMQYDNSSYVWNCNTSALGGSGVAGTFNTVSLGDGTVGTPAFNFTSGTGYGLWKTGSTLVFSNNGSATYALTTSGLRTRSDYSFGFAPSTDPTATADTPLYRDAAGVLALRNLANAMTFRVYSQTDGTNAEWVELTKSSNGSGLLQTNKSGTGSVRALNLGYSGTVVVNLSASGLLVYNHILPNTTNTSNLGSSSYTFANAYIGTAIYAPLIQSNGTDFVVKDSSGNYWLRATTSTGWTDSAATAFLQTGDSTATPNAWFTGKTGSAYGRLGLSSGYFQLSGYGYASSPVPVAFAEILTNSSTKVGLVVKTLTGQSANLQEWQVNGTALANITSNGTMNAAGYQVSGTALASSNLSDSSNLAKLNTSQTFTSGNVFTGGLTTTAFTFSCQAASTSCGGISVQKRGTTGDANAAVASGTELGYHGFYGWDGTGYGRGAYAITKSAEAFTTSAHGSTYGIYVTPTGSITEVARFYINGSGYAGINETSPGAQLQVTSSGAGVIGQIIKLASTPTADAFRVLASDGSTVLAQIKSDGTMNSAVGYQVAGTALASSHLSDGSSLAKNNVTNTFTLAQTFNDNITLNTNSKYLYGKTSGGTATRMFGLNASNDLYIGSVDTAINTMHFSNNGVDMATITSAGYINAKTGYQINGTQIASSALSNDSDLVKYTTFNVNTETAGVTLTAPSEVYFPAGACQGTVPGTSWSMDATLQPTPNCFGGTSKEGALQFDAQNETAYVSYWLPPDLTGNMDLRLSWFSNATTGTATWAVSVACFDPSSSTATAGNNAFTSVWTPAASTVSSTSYGMITLSTTGVAWPAACQGANKMATFKVTRTDAPGLAYAYLYGLKLMFRRAM